MCSPAWICCACAVRYVVLIVTCVLYVLHVLAMAEDMGQKWVLPNLYQADRYLLRDWCINR